MLTVFSKRGIVPDIEDDIRQTIQRLVDAEWDVTIEIEDDGYLEILARRDNVSAALYFESDKIEVAYSFEGVCHKMVHVTERMRRFTS